MRHNLINRRKLLGYTQKDVADFINKSRSTYTMYELGKANPSLDTARSIKKFLRYKSDDIFDNCYQCNVEYNNIG